MIEIDKSPSLVIQFNVFKFPDIDADFASPNIVGRLFLHVLDGRLRVLTHPVPGKFQVK